MRRPHPRCQADRERVRRERGNGLLGSVFGLACVMTCLGLVVNVSLGLWTRSTVDALTYDLARGVATAPADTDLRGLASRRMTETRSRLGPLGEDVRLDFEQLGERGDVVLRVRSPGVSLLPRVIGSSPTVGAIDRRIVVRREGR